MTVNKIEAIYYINLDYRKDRKKIFESRLKFLSVKNVIRIDAVNSKDYHIENWLGTKNEWAIRESHLKTLKHAQISDYKYFVIFEDDAEISKKFEVQLSKIFLELPSDWDMLYLYAENHFLSPIVLKGSLVKLQNTLGLVAVLYNSKHIDVIIKKIEGDERWVDSVMADLHILLNVYAPKKSIVKHPIGLSDNLNKFVDYKNRRFYNYFFKILNIFRNTVTKNQQF